MGLENNLPYLPFASVKIYILPASWLTVEASDYNGQISQMLTSQINYAWK